jgi:hypothetical protein
VADYSDIQQDALEDEGYQRLFEEIGPEWAREHSKEMYDDATRRFTEQRLKAYYIEHPLLANPAVSAVEYARSLMPAFPAAALVFAGTSIELTWKSSILKPLVAGLVHIPALAEAIVTQAVPKTGGLERVGEFLAEVLRETAGIDFKTYKRSGSSELLRIEMNRVSTERNLAVHQGTFGNVQLAHLAIEVADSLLLELLPKLLKSLGLTIDGMGIIGDYISIESSGRLVGNGI